MQRALFLDRDGIINEDKGYVSQYSDIVWMDGVFDIIKLANLRNYKVIVLTNQSGVARGMYKESDIHILHNKMNEFMLSQGIVITDWFYSIELDGNFRKPRPGMMISARDKYNLDLSKSIMIGDKESDVLEIENGPKTYLLKGRYPLELVENSKLKICHSLFQIKELLNVDLVNY